VSYILSGGYQDYPPGAAIEPHGSMTKVVTYTKAGGKRVNE